MLKGSFKMVIRLASSLVLVLACVLMVRSYFVVESVVFARKNVAVGKWNAYTLDELVSTEGEIEWSHSEFGREPAYDAKYPLYWLPSGVQYSKPHDSPLGAKYHAFQSSGFAGFGSTQYYSSYAKWSFSRWQIRLPIWSICFLVSAAPLLWLLQSRWNLARRAREGPFWGRNVLVERMLFAGLTAGGVSAIVAAMIIDHLMEHGGMIRLVFRGPFRLQIITLVFAIVGFLVGRWRWRTDARRRFDDVRFCINCGYDLRATPARCPECGVEIESPAMSSGSGFQPSEIP